MKQADIVLHLSKDHSIHKKDVTPIEALLLVSLHHKNAGKCPVEIIPGTTSNTYRLEPTEVEVEEDQIVVNPTTKKKEVLTTKVKKNKDVKKEYDRTENEEISRLRTLYDGPKMKALLNEVKTFPKEFDGKEGALELGVQLNLPTSNTLSQSGGK